MLVAEAGQEERMGASWSELTGTQLPVVAAPMAGGATVPALVAAVRSAGASASWPRATRPPRRWPPR
ncbi:hypothetical protein ACFQZC_34545 [Streptacidiphilus monticola]